MNILTAKCAYCGYEEEYILTEEEDETLLMYEIFGRQLGKLQELFPNIPAWIRSGAIDKYSNGFCICPACCPS